MTAGLSEDSTWKRAAIPGTGCSTSNNALRLSSASTLRRKRNEVNMTEKQAIKLIKEWSSEMSDKPEVFSIGIAMEEDTPKVFVYLRKRIPIPETYQGLAVVTRVIGKVRPLS
jgi:hypothetical protein